MLVLIGQAPNRTGDPSKPLEGTVGRKLAMLFGCTASDYLQQTQRMNLLARWPGKYGKSDKYPARVSEAQKRLLFQKCAGRPTLFIGLATARAFGIDAAPLQWVIHGDRLWWCKAAILPHPSGLNRWWNDSRHRVAARRFMRLAWKQAHAGV